MSPNWVNLRPLNGSQNDAFEKLCGQLARYEKVPQNSTFIAKGNPDAGVECYWEFPNGDEWAWQAKFFLLPPGRNQWSQIDKSVKTALNKHPNLTKYTICLPISRSDPRIEEKGYFMNKWDDHVKKWEKWAQERKMSVEFEYWGEDEILDRLSRDEHRGRHFFWFNREFFSKEWFENYIKDTISCVGPRYTPELNIELPIASLFDGLGRTSRFYTRIIDLYGEIARSYKKSRDDRVEEHFIDKFDLLQNSINELLSALKGIEEGEMTQIDWNYIDGLIEKSRKAVFECVEALETAMEQKTEISSHLNIINYRLYYIHELSRNLSNLQCFIQGTQAQLSNMPALLLVGNAGIGKTHLFCDVAKQRIQSDLPTVLLLGGHFSKGDPWFQIIDSVGVSSKEEFLGALEAAAQVQGTRALILIDALNEGEGKYFWDRHLAGMLTTLSRYPWIVIAVSVRTSYEDIIIPRDLVPGKLLREEHHGFAMHEYQAARTFFEHYGIEQPSIPLLVPEFQNPLFLGLFCKALYNSGLTRIPGEVRGTTWIFDFYINSVNEKLSRPDHLDLDPRSLLVQKAVENLAERMADTGQNWLPREDAKAIVDELLSRSKYEESLFRHLVSEGVISEDRFRVVDSEWCEGIHFSFERLGDYLIAEHLLDKYLNPNDPPQSFAPENPLGALVIDEYACWRNQGIIEALSIQLPERTGKELLGIAEFCAEFYPVCRAFVESLIWRNPEAITEETYNCINKYVLRNKDTFDQFLDALLTAASDPKHPYNADFLHEWMMKCSLAERDSRWSIFIFEQYEKHRAVDRLIDWAWSPEKKSHIDDESVRLCGTALAWFLTTSHRFLRDGATKALVNLLTKRIHVLGQIIYEFLDVNDPYVLERIFAVAYGCVMRSMDNNAIGELAQNIYEWIFKNGEPPPHLLLRDYARGVIELALYRGIALNIDIEKVRPPYKSEWPSRIPTEEELEKYEKREGDMSDEEWARTSISYSVEDLNIHNFQWSSHRLGEPREQTSTMTS